jgi:hypothetical protein
VPPIDQTPTTVIPRHDSDTGQFPAVPPPAACPCARPGACRRAACDVAWVLAWVTLGIWAYVDVRAVMLLWAWR